MDIPPCLTNRTNGIGPPLGLFDSLDPASMTQGWRNCENCVATFPVPVDRERNRPTIKVGWWEMRR
jgi:hypothetical protein